MQVLDKIVKIRTKKVFKYLPNRLGIIGDIGCGEEPALFFKLAGRFDFAYGIDRKIETKNFPEKNIEIINKDLDKDSLLFFSENTFDYIFMLAVLEHLEFPEKILREIYQLLKPQGKLILTTPTPSAKPVLELMAFYMKLLSWEQLQEHKHYFSKNELLNLLSKTGFKEIKHHYFELGFNQIVIMEK